MIGLGLDEVISYSLIDPVEEQKLHPDPDKALDLPGGPVILENSLSSERSLMRRTLLGSMLRTAWTNLRFLERIAIFELGHVYHKMGTPDLDRAETGVAEPRHIGALLTGPRQPHWWEDTNRKALDYFDLKGVADALLERLALNNKVAWARGHHPSFHPGRCAQVSLDGKPLGVAGELHPLVREAYDLPDQPVVLLEWDLDLLLETARAADAEKRVGQISNYPPVHEDLALVMDENIPALDVERAILKAGAPLVTEAVLFDIYRGAQVGAGKKSLAFALSYHLSLIHISEPTRPY